MEREEFKKLMMAQLKISCPYGCSSQERELFLQDYNSKLNYLYYPGLTNKDISQKP